MRLRYTSDFLW